MSGVTEEVWQQFVRDAEEVKKEGHQKALKKQQYKDWGKLGGRPIKEIKKTEIISIRFTPEEINLIREKAEKQKIKVSDYCRIILNEKQFPKVEENKTLITYANNFARISNFMKMGVFTAEEKKPLLDEIELVIAQIRENIKW